MKPRDSQKLFAEERRNIKKKRGNAKRTLSPALIRQQIKQGKLSPELDEILGKKPDGSSFTLADIERFASNSEQLAKKNKQQKGKKITQLIAASQSKDIKRANGTFVPKSEKGWKGNLVRGAARLYQIRGGMLSFSVKASRESRKQFHQVKIRLENWNDQLTNARANERTAAKNTIEGLVSIDCDCEHHQYTFRYVAIVGNYAITPPTEKDYPKIKNPELQGACCKHVIAAFQSLRSPTTQAFLAQEMKRQRNRVGFGDDAKLLTQKDIEQLKKARPRITDHDKEKDKARKLEQAEKALKETLSNTNSQRALQKKLSQLKARNKQAEKAIRQQEKQAEKLKERANNNAQAALEEIIQGVMAAQGISEVEARSRLKGML